MASALEDQLQTMPATHPTTLQAVTAQIAQQTTMDAAQIDQSVVLLGSEQLGSSFSIAT